MRAQPPDVPDRESLLELAVHAARAAGAIHDRHRRSALDVRYKSHLADLVTQVDIEAEVAIRQVIHDRLPQAEVLGEETPWPAARLEALHRTSCWIIDPLDGTQNYACGLPLSCVSVAYIERGAPLVGVVFHPTSGELYCAVQGGGATLNGEVIHVSARPALDTPALLGTGFPRDIALRPELLQPFLHLTARGLPVRRLGAAALSLAYLAAGRTDGYWDVKLAPWDVAAGVLLVQEAGGTVSDMRGQPLTWGGTLAASNGLIHEELLRVTRTAFHAPLP